MSVGVDVIVVIVLGLCGGFIHTLLYNTDKGFDLPKFDKTKNVYNLGSFDDMLFGIAAGASYIFWYLFIGTSQWFTTIGCSCLHFRYWR